MDKPRQIYLIVVITDEQVNQLNAIHETAEIELQMKLKCQMVRSGGLNIYSVSHFQRFDTSLRLIVE